MSDIKWRNDGSGLGDWDVLPDGVVMHDMVNRLPIQGAKAGQKQPTRPSIADDTIASISRLKMIIGLSEGEVKGLANGAKSIMLEGTPLEDENGNRNFEGVEWEIRHGTVDQTYIAGMPNASSEIGVGVTVRSDTPWIRSINNTQLSSINVNISFPMLKKVTDKGDVVGVTVDYAIDVQTDGGGYVPVVTKSLTAKTSGRYQRTHNVTLPEAQSNWQIRVRKITTDGDNETLFNTMQIDSIAEIVDGKFNYPHTAHLYLSLDARIFSNIPKVSVDMLGVYVQVPVNYDTETRKSTGIWNGQFKLGYTTNPAWHYYNLITNDRYGLGDKLQPFMIDKWSLEHIARICDERVDDGKGGTEPRFECNLYLQKAEDAYQVLQHIAGIFRGKRFWNGSKIFVDADTPRDCEYVITRANVIGGHFSKSGSAASDRHTIAQVAWSNPANAYETEYVMVRNERAIAQQGINVLDLSAVGCTSEGQAYRMGLAALLAEQNRTQTVSFAMGLDGSLPTVGSRIDIPDMMFTGANNGGRISSVNPSRTVITVDRDNVPATAGDKLIVNLESGKAQTRVITAVNGRAITVALAFDPVAPENVWSVISDELPTMPFIVMSVTSAEDGTQYNYTAMQYDPTMYSQIDNGTIIEQRPTPPSNNPYIIDAPDTVTLNSRHRVAQGINVTTLEITWSQVKDAVAYDVEWRKDDGDWIKIPRTGNISAEIDGVYSGNYLARVRAVSAFDAISKPTTSMLTEIKGKAGLPPTVVGLTATGILFGMDLKWGFAQGSGDAAFTEIQVGSAPGVNVVTLTQVSYPTNAHTITGLQGNLSQSYRARLVDKLGFISPWSAWVTGVTDANADKVMDLIEGQIRESSLNTALTTKIGKIDANESAISKETQDRIDDILAANGRIDSTNTRFINFEQSVTNELGTQGETLEGIISDYQPEYFDKTKYFSSQSQQWTYAKTVARDNYATNERITNLQSSVADSITQFIENLNTVATSTSATASKVTTLQTTVNGNTASIQRSDEVVDGLRAQSTTVLDVNGKVVGVGTYNDGKTGEFAVYADNFYVAPPVGGDNGLSQLVVRNTASVIDGVYVEAGLYTRNFYAPRASIDTIQIKDAAIKSAQIDNLAVTTGKIANLAVDTLQIAGSAVTTPILRYIPTIPRINYPASQDQYTKIAEATLGATEGMVAVVVGIDYIKGFQAQTGSDLRKELRANDTVLRTWKGWGATSRPVIGGNTYLVTELSYVSFPTVAGIIELDVVYSLWVRVLGNSNPWPEKAYIEVSGVTLHLTGVKK